MKSTLRYAIPPALLLALSIVIQACSVPDLPNGRSFIVTPTPTVARATQTPTVTPTPPPGFYTVKSGDTLFAIADRFGIPMHILAEANQLEDPTLLSVGQELIISDEFSISGDMLPTRTPTITPTATPRSCALGCRYEVEGCAIKGIIARIDGKRLYLRPTDSFYNRRDADMWFCHEADAIDQGWVHWTEDGPSDD